MFANLHQTSVSAKIERKKKYWNVMKGSSLITDFDGPCRIDKQVSKIYRQYNWDALRNLVPFMQFKKRVKHPWKSVTFSRSVTLVLKATLLQVFKLYKWYKIAQYITNHKLYFFFIQCLNLWLRRERKASWTKIWHSWTFGVEHRFYFFFFGFVYSKFLFMKKYDYTPTFILRHIKANLSSLHLI